MGLIPERCTKPQSFFENLYVVSIWCSFIVPTSHRGGSMRELFMLVPRGGKSIFRVAGPRREIASGFYKQRELHSTMVPLSTKSCLASSKLRPILNGQFCHAISKNICLNVLGSKHS